MRNLAGALIILLLSWGCRFDTASQTEPPPSPTIDPTSASTASSTPTLVPTPISEAEPTSVTPGEPPPPPSPTGTVVVSETVVEATPDATSPDFGRGSWQTTQLMPQPARSEMPAVTLGDHIYVPGGFGDPTRLDRYDPQTGQWQTLTPLPAGRHHLMAAAYEGHLYVFGGAQGSGWTPSDTVWRYDPQTDTWETLAPMPEARLAGTAVTLGDTIYLAGGAGGSEALLAYAPGQDTWQPLPGPQQPREHVSAVAFQGEVWLLGGRWSGVGELASVEIYDPAANAWRDGPPLTVARAGFAAAVVGERIVVAGGEVIFNGSETLDSLEFFDPSQAAWQLGPPLPVPIHGVGGAVYEGAFFLLGGSRRAGAIENEGDVQVYAP